MGATADPSIRPSLQHQYSRLTFSKMSRTSCTISLQGRSQIMHVVFPQSPNYANTHPHLTTISILRFDASFLTDNPTAFCTSRRCQTSNPSSSSLFNGTRSSCMIFVPNQAMHHGFLLLKDFPVGGMLSRWNISSLEDQSLTRPYFLLTETVGQKSSSASWTAFMWKALSTVTCRP